MSLVDVASVIQSDLLFIDSKVYIRSYHGLYKIVKKITQT